MGIQLSTKTQHSPALYVLDLYNDVDLLAIASKHCYPLVQEVMDPHAMYFTKIANKLSLQTLMESHNVSICVDFISAEMNHRLKQGHGKNQPLAKAIGLNKHPNLKVVDATAGLGRDAFVLASLGCQMLMIERSEALAELLRDGLQRVVDHESISAVVASMQLRNEDSVQYLQSCNQRPDVVYLDPMFPERKKSAKVKKEMQMLQMLHGAEQDEATLLNAAKHCALQRVVVKRPKGAEPICGSSPTHAIESKKMRYDVYMCLD